MREKQSELKILKKSEFGRRVEYVNVSADETEDIKGNRISLNAIKDEVGKFFKNLL